MAGVACGAERDAPADDTRATGVASARQLAARAATALLARPLRARPPRLRRCYGAAQPYLFMLFHGFGVQGNATCGPIVLLGIMAAEVVSGMHSHGRLSWCHHGSMVCTAGLLSLFIAYIMRVSLLHSSTPFTVVGYLLQWVC